MAFFVISISAWAGNIADPNDPNYDGDADPCFGLRGDVTRANNDVGDLLKGIGRELDNIQRSQDAQAEGLRRSAQSAWDAAQAAFDGAKSAAGGDARGFGQAVGDLTVAIGNFLPGVSGVDLSLHAKIRLQKLSDQLGPANQAAGNAKGALDDCIDKYEVVDTGNDDGGDFLISGEDGAGNTGGAGSGSGSGSSGSGSGSKGDSGTSSVNPDWSRVRDFTKLEVQSALDWMDRELDACSQFSDRDRSGCVNASLGHRNKIKGVINRGVNNSATAAERLEWLHARDQLETIKQRGSEMTK